MSRDITPPGKDFQIRCPRLGHQIYFEYCRRENMGQPCFKVLDCWFTYFKVDEFLKQDLGEQGLLDFLTKSGQPKMVALAEMIAEAQKKK